MQFEHARKKQASIVKVDGILEKGRAKWNGRTKKKLHAGGTTPSQVSSVWSEEGGGETSRQINKHELDGSDSKSIATPSRKQDPREKTKKRGIQRDTVNSSEESLRQVGLKIHSSVNAGSYE